MSPRELLPLAERVLQFGDEKYAPASWQEVPTYKFIGALMRHVGAALKGEAEDPESGLPHLAHAVANCAILWAKLSKKESS